MSSSSSIYDEIIAKLKAMDPHRPVCVTLVVPEDQIIPVLNVAANFTSLSEINMTTAPNPTTEQK